MIEPNLLVCLFLGGRIEVMADDTAGDVKEEVADVSFLFSFFEKTWILRFFWNVYCLGLSVGATRGSCGVI